MPEGPNQSAASAPTTPVPNQRPFLRRHWGKVTIAVVVGAPLLIFTIWAGVALSYSYSSGDRVGYVQKLARKGWLCKTWEGELQLSNIPGGAPVIFEFSIRSDSIAREIQKLQGRQVSLHYDQHVGVPSSCFGETEYFATGVTAIELPK
ncbi:MAG: hypothetical protein MNPFHGCM_00091 [Gemmatimonadaceae bacterium]|nr:hypothetical protein [Gemmatimonadaceae bacterium]